MDTILYKYISIILDDRRPWVSERLGVNRSDILHIRLRRVTRLPWAYWQERIHPVAIATRATTDTIPHDREACACCRIEKQIQYFGPFRLGH